MAINYKNVVSVQTHTGANGITAGISGFTLSNHGVSGENGHVAGTVITAAVNIIKHKGFVLVPTSGITGGLQVLPSYFGADGNALLGTVLNTAGNGVSVPTPLEVPLRMKSFTGLTGGSILFVV